jgi:hypothetical protein
MEWGWKLIIERAYSDLKELLHSRRYKEMSSALAVSFLPSIIRES